MWRTNGRLCRIEWSVWSTRSINEIFRRVAYLACAGNVAKVLFFILWNLLKFKARRKFKRRWWSAEEKLKALVPDVTCEFIAGATCTRRTFKRSSACSAADLIYIYGAAFTSCAPPPGDGCWLFITSPWNILVDWNIPFGTRAFCSVFRRYIVDFVNGVILRLPFTGRFYF